MESSTAETRMYPTPPAANHSSLPCQRRPRFNTIVAKFGFKLEDKKIVQLDQDTNSEAGVAIKTPKKAVQSATPRKLTPKKKRKVREGDDEEMDQNTEDLEAKADVIGGGDLEVV